ncbi:GNAT family N-acetyltransferase [Terrarubrum flagellatum]|uniref:GNAT family N-acetyltransferase n=1 Tax=Terrirubrum flagellatum TaxID=2895980 RepID=UPI00314508B4
MIPVLETERLVMRAFQASDFDAFAAFYADAELTHFVGGPQTRFEAWRNMSARCGSWILRGFGYWALEAKADGKIVGWCGLTFPEGWPEQEIGWSLFREGQGKGYATEAARAARDYAYNVAGWTTAISLIDPRNHASRKVAERLGARYERDVPFLGKEIGIYRHPSPAELKSSPSH